MTKQSKTLIALAAVVVVCAAGYVGLRTWNQSQSEVDETVYITQLSDPTALTFTNQYGTYSFTKGEKGGTGGYAGCGADHFRPGGPNLLRPGCPHHGDKSHR